MAQARRSLHRVIGAIRSLVDPGAYLHALRLLHHAAYSHVREKRKIALGPRTGLAPNVSFRNGERIRIGADCHLGEHCFIWAGDGVGRITIGDRVSIAPQVFITASNYQFAAGRNFREQPRSESHVVIGDDVWLGAGVVVTAGVTIGRGCIVGAGAVVTRDLPENAIAVGVPARPVHTRVEASFSS